MTRPFCPAGWRRIGGIHAGQAGRAGAAQQLQQHGFGLVVEVVGGQQQAHAVARAQAPSAA
jgi:signal recognition particle GTPase